MRYGVIYADPPWNWRAWSEKGTGRGAVSHYDTMSVDEIKKVPVRDLAAADCALFLWCPDNMIETGLEVIRAWGFAYKTFGFVWAKQTKHGKWHFGNGYWTRANPEVCLLATQGKPKRLSAAVRKLVIDQVREHSRKPDRIHGDIERLVDGPYVELFSRSSSPGWDVGFSDQAKLFDAGSVKTRRQPSQVGASCGVR